MQEASMPTHVPGRSASANPSPPWRAAIDARLRPHRRPAPRAAPTTAPIAWLVLLAPVLTGLTVALSLLLPAAPARAAAGDPADPQAAVPPLPASGTALAGYRRFAPPEPRSWREVNDTVARIGGWRVYLREAHAPEAAAASDAAATADGSRAPPPAAAPAGADRAAPAGHQGHGHGRR
jgi:hypothetical protein